MDRSTLVPPSLIIQLTRAASAVFLGLLFGCINAEERKTDTSETAAVQTLVIPKLSDFTLDGSTAEWKNQGVLITHLSEDSLPALDKNLFSSQIRVAWIEKGLVVGVNLHSHYAWQEHDNMRNAYSKDSIELFLRQGSAWKNLIQAVVAPGLDENHSDARFEMWDYRGDPTAWADEPPHVEIARIKQDDGGSLEIVIPWRQLRLEAKAGLEVEFRININKIISGEGRRQLTWRRNDGDFFQKLVLQEQCEPQHIASSAWFVDSDPYQVGFAISSSIENVGKTFSLKQGSVTLLNGKLSPQGNAAAAVYWLPHNCLSADNEELTVELEQKVLTKAKISNPVPDLLLQLERAFISSSYGGNRGNMEKFTPILPALIGDGVLPQARMPDQNLADLVGVQSIKTVWYDNNFVAVTEAKEIGRYAAVSTAILKDQRSFTNYQTALKLPEASLKGIAVNLGLNEDDLHSLNSTLASALNSNPALVAKIGVVLHGGADYPQNAHNTWIHQLRKSLGTEISYPFAKRLPTDYDTDAKKLWPAIIYLHGSSGRLPSQQPPIDERISSAVNRDLLGWAADKNKPFAMFALQSNGGWEPDAVLDTVERILAEYRIDPDRLIIMGFSMGGMGTWRCAVEKADRWAAAVPIAARGDQAHHVERVGNLPIWVVNGDADRTTTLEDAQIIVDAMIKKNIAHQFTILPNVGHGGSQNGTFETPGIWEWMENQKRK